MSAGQMLVVTGVLTVTVAVGWWVVGGVRSWRTSSRLHRLLRYHATLRADVHARYGSICTHFADRPVWTEQRLADLEWVFAQVDQVLDRRRLDDLAVVGRYVPTAGPARGPAVLGGLGTVALLAAAVVGL